FLLSLLCFVIHTYLHSFPTRRSSDLLYTSENKCFHSFFGIPMPLSLTSIIAFRLVQLKLKQTSPCGIVYLQALEIRLSSNISMIDRKSTRLNSSHVKISYAVFCLKKK